MNRATKVALVTVLAAAAAGALAVVIVRGQIRRHRRDLFSPRPFRRLAALGHMGREPGTVDAIRLLRDFIAWEPRKMLRERAESIVDRMTDEVARRGLEPGTESA
jgi:hypothetical protein